eukprot:scaffold2228_cov288-Pinguiococcus_pyrenoidosus.AAC.4
MLDLKILLHVKYITFESTFGRVSRDWWVKSVATPSVSVKTCQENSFTPRFLPSPTQAFSLHIRRRQKGKDLPRKLTETTLQGDAEDWVQEP